MIYSLVGGPRDGQFVDDLPRGYRLCLDGPRPARFAHVETVRAIWFELDAVLLRSIGSRD